MNDGSTDGTWKTILSLMEKYPGVEILGVTYSQNSGKGYAVRSGMNHARGKLILMLDGDGATDVKEIKGVIDQLEILSGTKAREIYKNDSHWMVIGSRSVVTDEEQIKRSFLRKLLAKVNNIFVKTLIGVSDINDTQCGFKLFTRSAAFRIVPNMHLNRWAFDVEMLFLAKQ